MKWLVHDIETAKQLKGENGESPFYWYRFSYWPKDDEWELVKKEELEEIMSPGIEVIEAPLRIRFRACLRTNKVI